MAKVTVLGSGTSVSSFYRPFDYRAPSGYLLQLKGKNYLLDCSEGIRSRLDKIRVDFYTIDDFFISHFHPDHFSLVTLMQSFMGRAMWGHETKTVNVYGPNGLRTRFVAIWDAMHNDGNFDNEVSRFLRINFFEFSEGIKININDDLSIVPFKVNHANMPAYSMRLNLENKTIAYSGDSGICPGLEKAAKNADLFICEANQENGEESASHLTVKQASEISEKNQVKKLVLTHLPGKSSEEDIISESNKFYHGVTATAHDFDVLQL